MRFLDNVLQDFIDNAPDGMEGQNMPPCGSVLWALAPWVPPFLQANNVPFESAMAKAWNLKMFRHIKTGVDNASRVQETNEVRAQTLLTTACSNGFLTKQPLPRLPAFPLFAAAPRPVSSL